MTRPPDPPEPREPAEDRQPAEDRDDREALRQRVNLPPPPDERQFAPVIFDDDERRAVPPPFAEYNDSGVMRVLGVVVLLAIVIAVLVLPPISILNRGGGGDSGGITAKARGELPSLPDGLAAVSPLYDLQASDALAATGGPWTLTVKLSSATTDHRNLGLYTYGSSGWLRVESASLTPDGAFAEGDVNQIPSNIAVLRRTSLDRTLGLIIPVGETVDPAALADATVLVVDAATLGVGDDGSAALTTDPDMLNYTSAEQRPASIYLGVTALPESTDALNQLLSTEPAVVAHVAELAAAAADVDANGIYLAYLNVDRTQQAAFTRLVTLLAERLSEDGRGLIVGVPAPATADTGAYDWPALVEAAAAVWLNAPADPSAFYEQLGAVLDAEQAAGLQLDSISLVVDRMSRLRDSEGVSSIDRYDALGRAAVLQADIGGGIAPGGDVTLTGVNVDTGAGASGIRWDPRAQAVSFSYVERSGARTVWVENSFSLAFRLDLIRRYELGGIVVANAQTSESLPAVWDTIDGFLQSGMVQLQYPYGPYLNPCWQATDGVIDGDAGNCWALGGSPVGVATWHAPGAPGVYEVGLVVSDGEIFVGRRVALRVSDTAGATPTPQAAGPQPTTEATAEPTVAPAQQPTAQPAQQPTAEPTTQPTPEPTIVSTPTPAPTAQSTPTPAATQSGGPPGPGGNE